MTYQQPIKCEDDIVSTMDMMMVVLAVVFIRESLIKQVMAVHDNFDRMVALMIL